MKRRWMLLVLGPVLLFGGCRSSGSIRDFESAPLYGMVYDAHNQPCPGAQVLIDEVPGPTTDINGRFVLPDLARGAHQIVVTKPDHETVTADVDFVDRTQVLYVKVFSVAQLLEQAEQALEERRDTAAFEFVERAAKVRASDPVVLYLKAVIRFRAGRGEEARVVLEQMLADGLRAPAVYLLLADVNEHALEDRGEAARHLEAYLSLVDDVGARTRLAELRE